MKKNGKTEKTKDRLYINDWLDLQPYEKQDSADDYFLQLANKLLKCVKRYIGISFPEQLKRTIALSVTAYFQDIISGFGLWNSFRNKYFSLYGKYLPFFDIKESYEPEEINLEDILFIIWSMMELDAVEKGSFINPDSLGIRLLGISLYYLLDEEYETAPESEKLQNYFIDKIDYDDFFSFREELYWLFYKSYLIAPYTERRSEELDRELKKFANSYPHENLIHLAYSQKYEPIFTAPCGPLALKTYEWIAAIVGEESDLGKMLLQTKARFDMPRTYSIERENDESYSLLPFDSDEVIELHKTSLQGDLIRAPGEDAALCSPVFYNGKWMASGFIATIKKNKFLQDKEEFNEKKRNIEHTKKLFQKTFPGKTIVYANGIDELFSVYKKLFPDNSGNDMPEFDKDGKFIIFLDKTDCLTILSNVAVFLKDKENPCFDQEAADLEGFNIFTDSPIPSNIIDYIIKEKLLSYLSLDPVKNAKRDNEIIQGNIEFLFRFFQPNRFS